MNTVPTFTATIWVGFRVGPLSEMPKRVCTIADVKKIAQAYCDEVGLCVTLTHTSFVYKGGSEVGAAVGLINYPRFPKDFETIRGHALELGEKLRVGLEQFKVSVVFPDYTVMLGEDKH